MAVIFGYAIISVMLAAPTEGVGLKEDPTVIEKMMSPMMKMKWIPCLSVGAVLATSPGWAAQTVVNESLSEKWQLDLAFHDPQRLIVHQGGEEKTYWYLLFTVTNDTDRDVRFFPSFTLVTDSLETVNGGENAHPKVYDLIKARHAKEYPFFAPPTKITGPILRGEANARTSAAVFQDFDPEANEFTIYISGLSNELKRITNPAFDPKKEISEDNPQFFILRKTLALTYELPGDPDTRRHANPVRLRREWVMR